MIYNATRQIPLAQDVVWARRFTGRLRGWLGRPPFNEQQALVLLPCRAIHTCGLGFPLDALFVGADGEVILALERLKPWRFSPVVARCRLVVELAAGRIDRTGTRAGDFLVFS